MDGYVDEVRFKLTGGVLECEIDNAGIQKVIEYSLRELQRYLGQSKFITVPFSPCIDTSEMHISDVRFVYVANPNYGISNSVSTGDTYGPNTDYAGDPSIYANTPTDPMLWSAYYLGSSGTVSNFTNYVDDYYAYVMTRKALNTGDLKRLTFTYNKISEKLYINNNARDCGAVTIEYIPRFDNVDEITNDAWIDLLVRFSVANLKITLGRVRTRFQQSNALWTQDGDQLIEEGNAELAELRTYLDNSASMLRPR